MKKFIFVTFLIVFALSCKQETYYNITTRVQPEVSGTIDVSPSSGSVLEGTSVMFKATPAGDYIFTEWGGSLSGTENPKTVTVSADMNVVANFELKGYPLAVSVEGDGTVRERVVTTKTDYDSGTLVELTARPAAHWAFDHWEGDLGGSANPAQIAVTSAKTVKAVFVRKMYDLTVAVEGEGTVSEAVIDTKSGSYHEGTLVELTARPATGWSFDHWEGDLSGADNPARVIISGAKSVKALFTKNKYTYNLKIVGPGVVDEYLLPDTKASLNYGTQVLLKAFPEERAVFKGWSGSYSGTKEEIIVNIDKAKEVVATFEGVSVYPLPNLMQPSVKLKYLCPEQNFVGYASNLNCLHNFDYNKDGYLDLIAFTVDWSEEARYPIRFYLGTPSGEYIPDDKNTNRIIGLNNNRKTITGDYNGDGLADFFLIGHGYDNPPFPGEYPVVLLSQPDGSYKDVRLTDYVSFYHGGASADIDNDGDLDVVLVDGGWGKEILLLNDGAGNFTRRHDLLNHSLLKGMFTAELYDIDGDGFCDFIAGLDDYRPEGNPIDDYNNMSVVFWGNGVDFNGSYTRLPKTGHKGMGLVLDYDFYDIDGDGVDEIILARTGDSVFGKNNKGWAIQIIKRSGRNFWDITDDVINNQESVCKDEEPIYWINFEEHYGKVYLVSRQQANARLLFELSRGKLHKVKKSKFLYPQNGFVIQNHEIAYNGWKQWDGTFFVFNDLLENGADISYLKDNDYALEFFIRNEDPSLTIDIKFESFLDRNAWKLATYFYGYHGSEHLTDGNWERVVIPLKKLNDWTDHSKNYWSMMDHVHFQISSIGGQPFSLKDIRIRKVLLE